MKQKEIDLAIEELAQFSFSFLTHTASVVSKHLDCINCGVKLDLSTVPSLLYVEGKGYLCLPCSHF